MQGKFFKSVATIAVSAIALAGCSSDSGSDSSSAAADTGRGPITFAMGKNDTDKLKPIIDKWNEANPEEKVSLKELAGEADDQRETLSQSLQAKKGDYDVFALDVTDTAYFAAQGWLQPIEGDVNIDVSGLLKPAVESATYNGKLFAVPQNTNAQILFYRTDLVEKAPMNWEELEASCEKAKAENIDCYVTQLKQYEGLTVNVSEFINGWGGSVVGPDGKTPTLDSAESKAGLQALVDAVANDTIAKRSDSFNEESTHNAFLAGETMYAQNWPYMYDMATTEDSSTVKDKVGVAPIVAQGGTGKSTLGGYNNAINAFSKNKETAADFISFVINAENQKSFAEQSFPPVLASVYDDAALVEKYPYMPALKSALENAKPRPVSPFYPAVSKAIQDNAYGAIRGEKSVDDAVAAMTEAIKQAATS